MRSAGDKSRHINIRFFFIKDILKREGIELIHCPTERMIADYYTKPLQGSLFRKMRDIVMGIAPFPAEERVESRNNEHSIAAEQCTSTENNSTRVLNLDTGAVGQGHRREYVSYADALRSTDNLGEISTNVGPTLDG